MGQTVNFAVIAIALALFVYVADALEPEGRTSDVNMESPLFQSPKLKYEITRPIDMPIERLQSLVEQSPGFPQHALKSSRSDAQGMYPEVFGVSIRAFGKEHQLLLQKNHELLSSDYKELRWSVDEQGEMIEEENHPIESDDECYYQGTLFNETDSGVAVSLCDGLQGVIRLQDEMIAIEPAVSASSDSQAPLHLKENPATGALSQKDHLVYHLSTVESNGQCGLGLDLHQDKEKVDPGKLVYGSDWKTFNPPTSSPTSSPTTPPTSTPPGQDSTNPPTDSASAPKYVETLVINDYARFQKLGPQTEKSTRSIMNFISKFYKDTAGMNVNVVLAGQVTWKTRDPLRPMQSSGQIETQGASGLLQAFNMFRMKNKSRLPKHDQAQLFSGRMFKDSIVGLAGVGTVCNWMHSGAVCQMSRATDPLNALVCGHELGHNLGMQHDGIGNNCPAVGFVMAAYAGSATQFSTCSVSEERSYVSQSFVSCLDNVPVRPLCIGSSCIEDNPDDVSTTTVAIDSKNKIMWASIIGAAAGVSVLLIGVAIYWMCRKCKRPQLSQNLPSQEATQMAEAKAKAKAVQIAEETHSVRVDITVPPTPVCATGT